MKKTAAILALFGLLAGVAFADESQNSDGKPVTVQGILIDTDCYFKEGQTGNDHDGMTGCGTACLNSGVPAGVLAGGKVYVLIFPSKAFANIVGKKVEVEGEAYEGNLIHPHKAAILGKEGRKPIQLTGFEMM